MLREKFYRLFYTDKLSAKCVANYLHRAKLLNYDPMETLKNKSMLDFLKVLNDSQPSCMHSSY